MVIELGAPAMTDMTIEYADSRALNVQVPPSCRPSNVSTIPEIGVARFQVEWRCFERRSRFRVHPPRFGVHVAGPEHHTEEFEGIS